LASRKRDLRILPDAPGRASVAVPDRSHHRPAAPRGDLPENLALSCLRCNSHKSPNLSGYDWETGEVVRLFHPRRDDWDEHFAWDGPQLRGRTQIGRVTIDVLTINEPSYVELRASLIIEGLFPPRR